MSDEDNIKKLLLATKLIQDNLQKQANTVMSLAEEMIDTLKEVDYSSKNREELIDAIKKAQFTWVAQLNEIILAQSYSDLNGQLINLFGEVFEKLNFTGISIGGLNIPGQLNLEFHKKRMSDNIKSFGPISEEYLLRDTSELEFDPWIEVLAESSSQTEGILTQSDIDKLGI